MRCIRLFLISLILLAACGQPNATSKSTKKDSTPISDTPASKASEDTLPSTLVTFIPSGYTLLDTAGGDLNRDSFPDLIIIAKKNGEDTLDMQGTVQRPLLILTGQPDGSLKLAARNDNVVLCSRCGGSLGDPYLQTVIKKGYFSIEYYGGGNERWTRIVTFKFSPADNSWYLHKVSEDSYSSIDPNPKHTLDTWSEKELGIIPFTRFNSDTLCDKMTAKKP